MAKLVVNDDGVIEFINNSVNPIYLWSIEFSYEADVERQEERGERKRIKRVITENIKVKKEIKPRDAWRFKTGLPADSLIEVKAYYREEGRFKRLTTKVKTQ